MKEDLLYKIALSKIPGIGSKLGKLLIAYCGGVQAIFEESKHHLIKIPGIGPGHVDAIAKVDIDKIAQYDLEFHKKRNHKIYFYLDNEYPSRLKHYDDAPLLFYCKGQFNTNAPRTIAIVGTRKPSHYGQHLAATLVNDLKKHDVQVISGLAHGIDAIVHRSACHLKIENIAVMGTGLDVIYPAIHRSLAQKICHDGALISEYPIRMRADKENFPRRNRIIAAMADAVVVVESAERGGSLITAEYGNIYNKDVFAFPGRIGDPLSAGCNKYIKQHKAHLIESADDIAYIMGWDVTKTEAIEQKELFVELTKQEQSIMNALKPNDQISIDLIHRSVSLPISMLNGILLRMEMKGLISSLPGKTYRRNKW